MSTVGPWCTSVNGILILNDAVRLCLSRDCTIDGDVARPAGESANETCSCRANGSSCARACRLPACQASESANAIWTRVVVQLFKGNEPGRKN